MKKKVFTVRDAVAEIYLPPFLMNTVGEASRAMLSTAQNEKTQFAQSPADFTLFEIGTYDDHSGCYEMLESHKRIGSISEMRALEEKRQEVINAE